MVYHVPVLLAESIEGLNIKPDGTYLDLTFGGGGHSREILKNLSQKGRLVAFDQDKDANANVIDDRRFQLIHGNFRYFTNYLKYFGVGAVDGLLADLGVSSHHFDSPERGFSFRFDGPLDMRMNTESQLSANEVVNNYSAEKLQEIFRLYGELTNTKKIVNAICFERTSRKIESIKELAKIISPLFPNKYLNKGLAQVFQSIRIEVNHEMDALKQMLDQTEKAISVGGRLVIISYHSLEDRMVKNFIKTGNIQGEENKDFYGNVSSSFKPINRKVIVPSKVEEERNPRARSAKLRIGEKL
jgi:16S rRNA (cytosine1402-N4)-methyltransferase